MSTCSKYWSEMYFDSQPLYSSILSGYVSVQHSEEIGLLLLLFSVYRCDDEYGWRPNSRIHSSNSFVTASYTLFNPNSTLRLSSNQLHSPIVCVCVCVCVVLSTPLIDVLCKQIIICNTQRINSLPDVASQWMKLDVPCECSSLHATRAVYFSIKRVE